MSPQSVREEPVLLIEAYELADDPKPSLGTVVTLIRKKELTASEGDDGFLRVPSLDGFNDELCDWKSRTRWSETRNYNALPKDHVSILAFCREHVAADTGRERRLFDGKSSPARFSSHALEYLKAGDLPDAQKVAGGMWAAPPAAVRVWLKTRFQIYVR